MPQYGHEGDFLAKLNSLVDRVENLERRRSVAIGRWRLSEQNGQLVGYDTVNNRTVVIAS